MSHSFARPIHSRPPSALWRLVLTALLSLLVTACGPGVGGTGTGAPPAALVGVTTGAVCTSELASALQCPGAGAGASAVANGTDAVQFAGAADRSALSTGARANLQGNQIDLQLPCLALSFSGQWGAQANDSARFHGWVDSSSYQGVAQLQVLVEGSAAGPLLVAQLWTADGRVLAGPVYLVRSSTVPAAPTAGQCP